MNPSPDDPSQIDAPMTRASFTDEGDLSLEKTEHDPARTFEDTGESGPTLQVTDPAMTRVPGPDEGSGWLTDRTGSSSSPRPRPDGVVETAGGSRRGIIGTIEPGQTLYAKYHVLKKLGGGAMGDVWLVRHVTLKSQHALKVIVPNFARNALALMRFQREFEVMATLRHEHAVTIFDACIDDDGGYIDMEFVDGLTLDTILANARARTDRDPSQPLMSFEWIVRVLEQLADVLHEAHEKGIVHRDLKPSNMMLLNGRKPGKEYLKVLDFGIAKIRDDPEGVSGREQEESSHKTEGFIGTPSYGSPEQALAMANVDGRADLYSVGIMLYEFITGRLPFRGSPLQVMSQNANAPPPPFSEANPKLRSIPEVEHAVFRALSKAPEHRPQSARELFEEFREAVEAVQPSGPPSVTPPTWDAIPFYSPTTPLPTTEHDNPGDDRALMTTMKATQVVQSAVLENPKAEGESMSDLGPVVSVKKAPPWRAIAGMAGVVVVLALLVVGLAMFRGRKPVEKVLVDTQSTTLKFEDYWPQNYVAVDASSRSEVWPEKVRWTQEDWEYRRFADGIYLPDGFKAVDPSKLVDGWPALIDRDGIRFVRIEGNETWMMGAWDAELEQGRGDVPAHPVKLSGYYLQETEVTNGQYEDFLEKTQASWPKSWEQAYRALKRIDGQSGEPSKNDRGLARSHPAVNLSRKQAEAFARSINARLPTEAQWEFAARSRGLKRRYVWGDATPSPMKANIDRQDASSTAPVQSYPDDKTLQGVYDMLGNVQEICRDVWIPYKKDTLPELDPCGINSGQGLASYAVRGASFDATPDLCSLTRRDEKVTELEVSAKVGFRLVVECPDTRKPR